MSGCGRKRRKETDKECEKGGENRQRKKQCKPDSNERSHGQ